VSGNYLLLATEVAALKDAARFVAESVSKRARSEPGLTVRATDSALTARLAPRLRESWQARRAALSARDRAERDAKGRAPDFADPQVLLAGADGDVCLHLGEPVSQAELRRLVAERHRTLAGAGLKPVVLEAKEGLALVNGTQAMQAVGALALLEAERCARIADIAAAMTIEGLMGSHRPFLAAIHRVRAHEGQARVAADLRALLGRSQINASHQDDNCEKVQDPYSLRCAPQVHGAARDALAFVRRTLAAEANAATDNPLVFAEALEDVAAGSIVSGGNFHGQPVAQALDLLAIACAQLQTISERRVEQLVNPSLSGLPPFLAKNSGLNSGFMIAQVTAAALAAETKLLAHPACVDTIPSSAGREDHVSMGMTAALKARTAVENACSGLAIELLVAAQALDLRRPLRAGVGAAAAHEVIRKRVAYMEEDRELHRDIAAVREMLPEIESAARAAAGLG